MEKVSSAAAARGFFIFDSVQKKSKTTETAQSLSRSARSFGAKKRLEVFSANGFLSIEPRLEPALAAAKTFTKKPLPSGVRIVFLKARNAVYFRRWAKKSLDLMKFSTMILAIAAAVAAQTAVGFFLEQFFPIDLRSAVDTPLDRAAPLFEWNLATYFLMAVLAGLLFHSLAIPGSKIQRGIYVGLTAGTLASLFGFFSWMAEFDLPMSLFQRFFIKNVGSGLVAGVIYSLFWLKKRGGAGDA